MKNTLAGSLVDGLNCSLVSAIGLLTIAFRDGSFKLLQGGLQGGLVSLVALVVTLAIRTLFFADLMLGITTPPPIA